MKLWRAGSLLVLLLCAPSAAGSAASQFETFTLENGLTVLVRRVTSAKDAAVVDR